MVRKPATLKDVAALANVSRATAARALNSYGYVGDETAQKVQAAAEKLGYRGNRLAQALRNGQLPIVGCILGDIQNPFFARIAHDIEALARECGHNLVIGSSEEELDQEISLLSSLRSLSIRGFIVAPTSATNNAHLQSLNLENVPLVLIDRVAEDIECDHVVVDNEGGARKAVEYLIAMGHRRIGLLQDDMRIFTSRERMTGYRTALAAGGIAPDDRLIADLGLDKQLDKRLGTLSGGTRQKVSAVLACRTRPSILVMDEPTAGLDPLSSRRVLAEADRVRSAGGTVLITSHLMEEVESLADRVAYLEEGTLRFLLPVREILEATGTDRLAKALPVMLERAKEHATI